MALRVFNELSRDEAVALLRPCLDVQRWWTTVVDHRAYLDEESLLEMAREAAYPLTGTELEAALHHHLATRPADWLPAGLRPGGVSAVEGARSGSGNDVIVKKIDEYEQRFGRPFVIRTAGRTVNDIAMQLDSRLGNQLDVEDRNIARELRQIALLRLSDQIAA